MRIRPPDRRKQGLLLSDRDTEARYMKSAGYARLHGVQVAQFERTVVNECEIALSYGVPLTQENVQTIVDSVRHRTNLPGPREAQLGEAMAAALSNRSLLMLPLVTQRWPWDDDTRND